MNITAWIVFSQLDLSTRVVLLALGGMKMHVLSKLRDVKKAPRDKITRSWWEWERERWRSEELRQDKYQCIKADYNRTEELRGPSTTSPKIPEPSENQEYEMMRSSVDSRPRYSGRPVRSRIGPRREDIIPLGNSHGESPGNGVKFITKF